MSADPSTPSQPQRRRIVEWFDPGALAAAGQGMDGLALLRALIAGAFPPPPVVALLGIDLVTAEAECVTFRMEPGEHLYNPLGSVHGGMIATAARYGVGLRRAFHVAARAGLHHSGNQVELPARRDGRVQPDDGRRTGHPCRPPPSGRGRSPHRRSEPPVRDRKHDLTRVRPGSTDAPRS